MLTGILKAQGLYKSYKDKEVLHNLDLTIEPGKIYGLIGRNGAGKTTLLGILTAQNTKDRGEVTYDGQPVWENRRHWTTSASPASCSPPCSPGRTI